MIAIYDGLEKLGSVTETATGWRAFNAEGVPIGGFPTRAEATDAVITLSRDERAALARQERAETGAPTRYHRTGYSTHVGTNGYPIDPRHPTYRGRS